MFTLSFVLTSLAAFASAANYKRYACPDGKNTALNPKCCVFYSLRDDMNANIFQDTCGEDSHEVLRLTFHDAIGFSQSGKFKGNGADGSIMIFEDIETHYGANAGIEDAIDLIKPFLTRHDVSAGDLIQFAGALGVSDCPGAPRLEFMAGRANATIPAEDGAVPEPQQSVDELLERMADAGFTPEELIHLLASHTIAQSSKVDPSIEDAPFDTTPFDFDTQIFLEVLLKGTSFPGDGAPPKEVLSALGDQGAMRLASDAALARDPRTSCEWQSMVDNQTLMNLNFKNAMAKMAITGFNRDDLYDCSEVIPEPKYRVPKRATYPAGKSAQDLEQACAQPFPTLEADAGEATGIPVCPIGGTNCASS